MVSETTVVIATHNRALELSRTLEKLAQLDPISPVIVVDNASTDHTARVVEQRRKEYPNTALTYVRLPENAGAVARNYGIWRAQTPYVAFADDDSWWEPDALRRAEHIFAQYPKVALVAARTLVGSAEVDDPINALLAESPLGQSAEAPGPEILGFLACACIARTEALRECGGFSAVLQFVGEERLLAYELAARGWILTYCADVVAHHYPSTYRVEPSARIVLEQRNEVLTAVMKRPPLEVAKAVGRLAAAVVNNRRLIPALSGTIQRLPRAVAQRRPVPTVVECRIKTLENAVT